MEAVTQSMLQQRFDKIVVENPLMRDGFAALPYSILKDTSLGVGARLAYGFLLMYAWQEGSCFAGQQTMAGDMGVSARQLRRYLKELQSANYIRIERKDRRFNNTYYILDRKLPSKQKRKRFPTR